MIRQLRVARTWCLPFALLGALSCTGIVGEPAGANGDGRGNPNPDGMGDPGDRAGGAGAPTLDELKTPYTQYGFTALPIRVGAGKAKDLLTGHALTAEEHVAVEQDPGALKGLIDTWIDTPEFDRHMNLFFRDAFQQGQPSVEDFKEFALHFSMYYYIFGDHPEEPEHRFRRSVNEMFARTVVQLVKENRPFTETITTRRFMMNTPLMVLTAYQDTVRRDDEGWHIEEDNWILKKWPNFRVVFTYNNGGGSPTRIPVEESMNPSSPNFMRWYIGDQVVGSCGDMEYVHEGASAMENAFGALSGRRTGCNGGVDLSLFTDEDWNSWRWVEIRTPGAGEEPTLFFDVPGMRRRSELVVQTSRVGFFTTQSFFLTWLTNGPNSMRVTANQALIVALGRALTDTAIVPVVQTAAAESEHADPGTVCYSCHQTLDPIRDFLRHDYGTSSTPRAHSQDPYGAAIGDEGVLNFAGGPVARGRGVVDFARALAEHPAFATGWTQKLCMWANTAPCAEDDPEFVRVAEAFKASGFNFKVLLRELLSSPLTTYHAPTATAEKTGVVMSIARRDVLCKRLSARLGYDDICNLGTTFHLYARRNEYPGLRYSLGVPGTDSPRGAARSIMPRDPALLFQPAADRLCGHLSISVLENIYEPNTTNRRWSADDVETTLNEFVTVVMGVPAADPVYPKIRALLQQHYEQAMEHGTSIEALRSAFIVACSSPITVSTGL